MPKPDVVALTGGYRRTPFMQIGADVYCDSALMCRVIDRIAPEPPLYPEATRGLDAIVAQWADSALFWTAVPFTMQPAAAPFLLADATPESLRAFAADRAAMNPTMRRAPWPTPRRIVNTYAARLEAMLGDSRPFLLGALPSIADFSAAQSIWFMRRAPPVARHLEPFARVLAWYERVAALRPRPARADVERRGDRARARQASSFAPCAVAAGAGPEAGAQVGVTPSDYAFDEVVGTLVGLDGRRGRHRAPRRARRHGPRPLPAHRISRQGDRRQERRLMKDFKGRTAVITGAGSGFGLETSRIAARLGMNVVMADVQADALERAAAEIESLGAKVLAQRLDVSKAAEVEALGRAVAARFGAPHVVFNNAGVGAGGLIWENTLADWEWVMGVNVMGVVHGVRAFTPMMLDAAAKDPRLPRATSSTRPRWPGCSIRRTWASTTSASTPSCR